MNIGNDDYTDKYHGTKAAGNFPGSFEHLT